LQIGTVEGKIESFFQRRLLSMKTKAYVKPTFLPHVADERMPKVPEGTVETLAFILGGVDPSERLNPSRVRSNLRQLIADLNVKRVSSSSLLRDDHLMILSPRFDFGEIDFESVWQDAKNVSTGQESTEFLKLVRLLQRLQLDEAGTELRSSKNAETIKLLHAFSHKLLYRVYRTAVRHIEEIAKRPLPSVSEPWYGSLLTRIRERRSKVSPSVSIDEELLAEAQQYLENAIKIGRLLHVTIRKK
jgi:hypothetical protein